MCSRGLNSRQWREIQSKINIAGVKNKVAELKERDEETYLHSMNVAWVALQISINLDLPKKEQEELVMTGLLHDIGKIIIPSAILNKTGKLSKIEFDTMKAHVKLGVSLLENIAPERVVDTVRKHHERCDGSGYPNGLVDKEISVQAKIIACADILDALVSKRPYKEAYSLKQAMIIMHDMCNKNIIDQKAFEALEKFVNQISGDNVK